MFDCFSPCVRVYVCALCVVQCLCGSHKTTVGLGFLPLLVISVTELSKEVPYLLSPVFGVLFYLFVLRCKLGPGSVRARQDS